MTSNNQQQDHAKVGKLLEGEIDELPDLTKVTSIDKRWRIFRTTSHLFFASFWNNQWKKQLMKELGFLALAWISWTDHRS